MPKLNQPEAIFFDVDGVLIDSLAIKGDAFSRAFSDYPERAGRDHRLPPVTWGSDEE